MTTMSFPYVFLPLAAFHICAALRLPPTGVWPQCTLCVEMEGGGRLDLDALLRQYRAEEVEAAPAFLEAFDEIRADDAEFDHIRADDAEVIDAIEAALLDDVAEQPGIKRPRREWAAHARAAKSKKMTDKLRRDIKARGLHVT